MVLPSLKGSQATPTRGPQSFLFVGSGDLRRLNHDEGEGKRDTEPRADDHDVARDFQRARADGDTSKQNKAVQYFENAEWWADNGEAVNKKWEAFKLNL